MARRHGRRRRSILVGMDIADEEEDWDEIEDALRCITDQKQDKKQQVSYYHVLDGELDGLSHKAETTIEYPEDGNDEIADALRCIIDQQQDKKQQVSNYHKLDGVLEGLSHKAEATIEYPEDGDTIEESKQETFASSSSSAAAVAATALGGNNSDNSTNTNTNTTTTATIDQETEKLSTMMFDLWGGKKEDNNFFSTKKKKSFHVLTKLIDKNWGQGLYQMEHHKRVEIQEELHGIKSRCPPETAAGKERAFQQMEEMLHTFQKGVTEHEQNNCSTYTARTTGVPITTALLASHLFAIHTLQSTYVTSSELRIAFIRHDLYEIEQATIRYLHFCTSMYDVWGYIALLQPLYLSDLTPREIVGLKRGNEQLLNVRDHKLGRRIYVMLNILEPDKSLTFRERLRIQLYLRFTILLEDETAQQNGAVNITFMRRNETRPDSLTSSSSSEDEAQQSVLSCQSRRSYDDDAQSAAWIEKLQDTYDFSNTQYVDEDDEEEQQQLPPSQRMLKELEWINTMKAASPIRYIGQHYCMPDEKIFHFFKAMMLTLQGSDLTACTRVHAGSQLESMYGMCPFGIPIEDIPITATGNVKNKGTWSKLIKTRKAMDNYRKKRAQCLNVPYFTKQMEDNWTISDMTKLTQHKIPLSCPGIDCPAVDCYIFGDKSQAKHRRVNIDFVHFLKMKLQQNDEEQQQETKTKTKTKTKPQSPSLETTTYTTHTTDTAPLNTTTGRRSNRVTNTNNELDRDFLFDIIHEVTTNGMRGGVNNTTPPTKLRFARYNKTIGWYEYLHPIHHREELRKLISQCMRDEWKRNAKKAKAAAATQHSVANISSRPQPQPRLTTTDTTTQSASGSATKRNLVTTNNGRYTINANSTSDSYAFSGGSNTNNTNNSSCFLGANRMSADDAVNKRFKTNDCFCLKQ